jgi:hypothetical protein
MATKRMSGRAAAISAATASSSAGFQYPVIAFEAGDDVPDDAPPSPKEVDAIAMLRGSGEQADHQIDARHALLERAAQQARRPNERLTVRADQVAAIDDRLQLRIAVGLHDLVDVDGDVLMNRSGFDETIDPVEGFRHSEVVDGKPEHRNAAWGRRVGHRRKIQELTGVVAGVRRGQADLSHAWRGRAGHRLAHMEVLSRYPLRVSHPRGTFEIGAAIHVGRQRRR